MNKAFNMEQLLVAIMHDDHQCRNPKHCQHLLHVCNNCMRCWHWTIFHSQPITQWPNVYANCVYTMTEWYEYLQHSPTAVPVTGNVYKLVCVTSV